MPSKLDLLTGALSRISNRFHAWARGWLILAIIITFVIIVNLPLADPDLVSKSLDGRFFYTPAQAFATLAAYGETGRRQMIWIHLADFILIVVYTTMFCLSISWLFQRSFAPNSIMQRLNLVPLLGGFFDVMENVWIMTLLFTYPAQLEPIAWLSAAFTVSKYLMGIPIILLLLFGLGKAAGNRFKGQEA